MKGLKFFKGNISIENNDFVTVFGIEHLKYRIENFVLCDPSTVQWDFNRGLDRKIIFSNNESAIRSETRNKILRYFADEVNDIFDIEVTIDNGAIFLSGKMNTIYGEYAINTERRE